MKITYDREVDAVYIRLNDDPAQVTTQCLSEDVAINVAPNGAIVGIEILDASTYIPDIGTTHQVMIEDITAVSA